MVLLAVSVVMAGSGNLKVLQLCRFLHKHTCGEMNYVFHMSHHMTLGLLFPGTHSAIAALLCALYPHFPAHSSDNRYHLLALRHLAVFAAEPRLLVSVDVDTLQPCYALLDLTYRETQWYEETTVELMAPTMLPELHLLKRIKVKGPRYWELNIDISKGTQHLQSILSKDGVLYVKLHAGQLPNKDDPKDWKSLLAPNLNNRSAEVRTLKPEAISTFTSDAALVSFASENMKHKLSAILYECVTQEYPEMLPTHISIDQITVMCYLRRQPMNNDTDVNMLACFLVYHSIPSLKNMEVSDLKGCSCFPELLFKSSQLGVPVRALLRLSPLLLQKHDSGV